MGRGIAAILVGLMICLPPGSLAQTDVESPDLVVQQMTFDILRALGKGDRPGPPPEENSAELYAVVDQVLAPRFDFDYASKLVLGRFWKTATPAEREDFVESFYDYLVRVYSHALLSATKDTLEVLSYSYGLDEDKAVVKTLMRLPDGTEVAVDYRMRLTDNTWKVWDVVANGVSYVKIYRADFGAISGTGGVSALNEWLQSQQSKR
ncbi:MAG: ABC transporter substrate-binding protein [Gammaproteobacteria bacterium]